MKICVTGASGFIGSAIVESLKSSGIASISLVRDRSSVAVDAEAVEVDLEDLSSFSSRMFNGCDALIHTAARAHLMKDGALDLLTEYRKINRDATLQLARMASLAGVKRFVFLSSIGVNGVNSNRAFTEIDKVAPHDDYSLSKYEAELGLLNIARDTNMELVIIRPPLVYGPGAPGNFRTLVRWVNKSIPMPLGSVHNLRSFVALDNLIDFVILCADKEKSPEAANEVFLISDSNDISTSELLKKVANAYGVKSRLLPAPVPLMRFVAKIFGIGDISDRLFGNLQVDSSKAKELLGWNPVINMDKQLEKIAAFDKSKKE